MAFLCPPMFSANRKKRDRTFVDEKYLLPSEENRSSTPSSHLGRVFSSTLSLDDDYEVNVFLTAKRDYKAMHPSELSVKRNDIVMFLHKDRNWLFVRQRDGYEGYVPRTCCRIYDPTVKQIPTSENWVAEVYHDRTNKGEEEKEDKTATVVRHPSRHESMRKPSIAPSDCNDIIPYNESMICHEQKHCCHCNLLAYEDSYHGNKTRVQPNNNNQCGCNSRHNSTSHSDYWSDDSNHSTSDYVATVTKDWFDAREGSVPVRRGEMVTIVYEENEEWLFVRTTTDDEGFIPSAVVTSRSNCKGRTFHRQLTNEHSDAAFTSTSSGSNQSLNLYGATKLTVIRDYQAAKFDELTVYAADTVHVNLKEQIVPGFTWVYLPRTKSSGFVPTRILHSPKITNL